MSKSRRYTTEAEIIAEIDRLKDDVPALYDRAKAAEVECKEYLNNIGAHLDDYNRKIRARLEVSEDEHPNFVYKKLKKRAKRAAGGPFRQEEKLKKLADALSEFRTNRMPFLTDSTVEVK